MAKLLFRTFRGRQSQGYGVNIGKSQATGTKGTNIVSDVNANQSRAIKCHNCKGEGHIAKQCTVKKRAKDVEWFKEKMLLAQAQEPGVILHEDQQNFLADMLEDMDDYEDLQLHTTSNFKSDHVDAYDLDCDDEATACAIFMATLSLAGSINRDTAEPSYDSELLSEVPHYDTYHEDTIINDVVQEMEYNDHVIFNDNSCDELTSNSNVISYADYTVTIENDAAQYVPPPKQDKNAMILFVIKQMKGQVEQCNTVNLEAKCVNESLSSELERYKEKVKILEEKQTSKEFFNTKRRAFRLSNERNNF
ncbi:integrase, catalytic region, zinc finger, CCHC-type containing protein [Tanacetum coccineum]|uniref:Integrase, catalytic region, zinc finger, CCHC-type containing protein n=1 Tax=Tanacetum coccineum TaxID=301880 RepID=A0ABQ5FJG1_9ASTR